MTDSVKERVLKQIVAKLEAFTDASNNGVQFDFVSREELIEEQMNRGKAISVIDGNESFIYQTAYLQCSLEVSFDYAVKLFKGDVASTKLGLVHAELKKVFLSDINLIETGSGLQLCENVRIREYLPDRAGPNDDVATALSSFEFIYRENKEDPYQLV